jgi:hypothetical protein
VTRFADVFIGQRRRFLGVEQLQRRIVSAGLR